jgi:hypothetical protein
MMTDGEGGDRGRTGSLLESWSTIGGFGCMTLGGCRTKEAQFSYQSRSTERNSEYISDYSTRAGRQSNRREVPCSGSI